MKWMCLFILFFNHVGFGQSLSNSSRLDPNKLVAKIKIGATAPKSHHALSQRALFNRYVVYSTNHLEALKQDLENDPSIESVHYNYFRKGNDISKPTPVKLLPNSGNFSGDESEDSAFNDPYTSRMWSLTGSEGGINLFEHIKYLKNNSLKKTPIIVAVLDTGVDVTHQDLKDKMWINKKEIRNNNIDDDNNGYIDDVYGINTVERDRSDRATGNILDTEGHGTHVSGTIAAKQNNGLGIAGISSHAQIMAVRTVPTDGSEMSDLYIAESMLYAANMGARIINCSFGKSVQSHPGFLEEVIGEIAKEDKTLIIAAAGNDNVSLETHHFYPQYFDSKNLLVVAATHVGGGKAEFSNYGPVSVDLAAPGTEVISLTLGNLYAAWGGTSMAAPNASGVAAEILSLFPQLSALQLKDVLMQSVRPHQSLKGKIVSGGEIDISRARELAQKFKMNNSIVTQKITNGGFQNSRF